MDTSTNTQTQEKQKQQFKNISLATGIVWLLCHQQTVNRLTDRMPKIDTSLMGLGKNQKLDPMVQLFANFF
jgi:hypothetical protein